MDHLIQKQVDIKTIEKNVNSKYISESYKIIN